MGNSAPIRRSSTLARLCRRGSITGPELRASVQVARLVEAVRMPDRPARAGLDLLQGGAVPAAACQVVVARENFRRRLGELSALCEAIERERDRRPGTVAAVLVGVLALDRAPGELDRELRLRHGTAAELLRDVPRAAKARASTDPAPIVNAARWNDASRSK